MATSPLHVRPDPNAPDGRVIHVTPKSAGWTYVGFDVYRLAKGATAGGDTASREVCLVFLSGKAAVTAGGKSLGVVGERMSPFDGKPWSMYVSAGSSWNIVAETDVEVAVCSAPAAGGRQARIIDPKGLTRIERGNGTDLRRVINILPETDPTAESLILIEVITPGGHWSSYPPHKHDTDALPAESQLEETYYHRIDPAQGFAFQRIYSDDRSLDETIAVSDGDVTLVPFGYHPCAAPHGYDLYYLNVMAGPRRAWRFRNEPAHDWLADKPSV
jgi:5-deoxy-glucuronate isomerase